MNRFVLISLILGAALVTAGFALAYHPAGFVVGGGFFLWAGIAAVAKSKK